jgi:hypothetical protein
LSMFFPLVMLYGIYFTFLPRQFLGYELEEKQYNIFPPGPVFFLLVTEKLVKRLMGERKMIFFPISIFFPHGPCCIWQCCGSGSGNGSVRIRNFWPDPDPIRNRNKHFGSGFETGSEINQRKGVFFSGKNKVVSYIFHIYTLLFAMFMLEQAVWLGTG